MGQLDKSNDSYYHIFKNLFEENINLFNRKEKHNLFIELESCCWKKINNNVPVELNKFYQKELFEIYKKALKEGLCKSDNNDYIRISMFRNIIIAALNMREFDWLEEFIKKYSKELAPEHRENMFNYGLGIVNFRKGNFEKSLELMSNIKYEYFYLRIDVKNWMLQNHYELNHFEQAYSLIDSYKHFLSKNKNISEFFRKFNNDFLNCFVKLIKIKSGDDSFSLSEIKQELSKIYRLAHKGWIIRKIEELEKISAGN